MHGVPSHADHDLLARQLVSDAREQFRNCHAKISHCASQLSDAQLWHRQGELNSIANLLLHLTGNVGQRIGSLIGGEPDTRDRAQEFAERKLIPKSELMARFEQVMRRADEILAELSPDQLLETRRYRMLAGEVENTLAKLILQTLVHVGGHTQEIIALTRLELGANYRFLQTPAPTQP